jgi:hypothetical protein
MDWEDLVQLIFWPIVCNSEYDAAFFKNLPSLHREAQQLPRSERSLARLIDMLYRHHGKWIGTEFERWGDKTPINVNCMNEIVGVFPDVQFVFLLRDGTDVVHSHMDALGNTLRCATRKWKQSTQFLKEFQRHHPNQCRVVRYEDLVRNPETETRRLCDYLDLEFSPSMVEANRENNLSDLQRIDHHRRALTPITDDRIGVGHEALAPNEKQTVKDLIGVDLREWGYSISV